MSAGAKEPALEARGIPSGDFHEYFEINNIPPEVEVLGRVKSPLETLKSKLFFNGHAGKGNFLTLPSQCGPRSNSISYVEIESDTGEIGSTPTVPPVGIDGCGKNVPFEPNTKVTPQAPQYDQPDGAVTDVTVPQNEKSDEVNTADIAEAHATFPEGLTLNPSAAHGLDACSPAKIHFESKTPAECPAGSNIGKVKIETDLPPGSLTGSLYLGSAERPADNRSSLHRLCRRRKRLRRRGQGRRNGSARPEHGQADGELQEHRRAPVQPAPTPVQQRAARIEHGCPSATCQSVELWRR